MLLELVPNIANDKSFGYTENNPLLGEDYRIGWLTDGLDLSNKYFGSIVHIYVAFCGLGGSCIVKILFIRLVRRIHRRIT